MNTLLKKSILSSAIFSALSTAPQVAAQANEQLTDMEVIQVTSFRRSLIKAKDMKREAIIARDSILAEDIADFPDLNLADAL